MSKTIPTSEQIRYKYMPNGSINIRLIGGGNGKPQYEYEKVVMRKMLTEFVQIHLIDLVEKAKLESESQHGYIDFDAILENKLKMLSEEVLTGVDGKLLKLVNEHLNNIK